MNEKPCTAEEIDAYFEFASLPLAERRRRVYLKYMEIFPDSELTTDILMGRKEIPKARINKRSRNPKAPKATTSKPVTKGKASLPFRSNPEIDFDD